MDKIFEDFKNWITSKVDIWKQYDVIIDEVVESTHAHQIHINLHSHIGFGHMALFESNNIYWIEFEAVDMNEENFYRHLEFDSLPCLLDVEKEYLYFLTNKK